MSEVILSIIGKTIKVMVDRPKGSRHPKYKDMIYPINYGYVEGVFSGDGEEQDVYILGVDHPISSFEGEVIAIIKRLDDNEDKWVASPHGVHLKKADIIKATEFQEKYFDTEIIM